MTNQVGPAPASLGVRRYPLLGGAVASAVPLLAGGLAAGAVIVGSLDVAVGVAALGWAGYRLSRSAVVEISPTGLTRGLLAMGAFRARTTVIPWPAIVEVHTAWCGPGDDSALETAVRDREGRVIRLSTAMGLAAYWACLAEIVRRAPAAARSGITDGVLAGGPPARHDVVSATRTAAALALVLVALVSIHYLWAQGRSSLSRDLERIGAAGDPRTPACAPVSPSSSGRSGDRRGALGDSCR
ncbi:MAG: hypothetical protein ACREKJ_07330 [Candidatus Rokuibacteriota bacterium]